MKRLRTQLVEILGDEPVTLPEMLLQLRVDTSEEDALIRAQVAAAREYAEGLQDRALVEARYLGWLDAVPTSPVEIPLAGDVEVEEVALIDVDGAEVVVPAENYVLDGTSEPALLFPRGDWPSAELREKGGVRVTYTVGPRGGLVPQQVRAAIKLMAADLYEHREETLTGTIISRMPTARLQLGLNRLWRA